MSYRICVAFHIHDIPEYTMPQCMSYIFMSYEIYLAHTGMSATNGSSIVSDESKQTVAGMKSVPLLAATLQWNNPLLHSMLFRNTNLNLRDTNEKLFFSPTLSVILSPIAASN